jgi:large subunit ribosomal protein L30
MKKVKVTKIGATIGRGKIHEKVLIGLGLRKMNSSKVLDLTDSVQGMIDKVSHLIRVEYL